MTVVSPYQRIKLANLEFDPAKSFAYFWQFSIEIFWPHVDLSATVGRKLFTAKF